MKSPAQVYERSQRKYEGTPSDLEYGSMPRRKVSVIGKVSFGANNYFISQALSGWSVGLQCCGLGLWNVWFGRLLLGQIEESTASFRPAKEQIIAEADERKNAA